MGETRQRRRRLGEILVAAHVITEDELEHALAAQLAGGRRDRLGTTVVALEMCTEEDIAEALARQLGYETVDLAEVGADPSAVSRVPRKLAERHHALPLRIEPDDVLLVAMSDPTNVVALDDLKLTSGLRGVRPVVATSSSVSDALRRAYGSDQAALEMVDAMGGSEVVSVDDDPDDVGDAGEGADQQPIIRLANAVLADAVRLRASDVHIEPEREAVRVRYRVDGMLREVMRIPRTVGPALVSRLKIISGMDIAERRRPQDGRAMIRVEGQEVDLRVSSMPTMFGETMVMRLLRKGAERLLVDDLGMTTDKREAFRAALFRPQGLIVITGPTGSGKTTTLYAGLSELADPVRNIITLEDPIEFQLNGVNQTQMNPKIDLTFARGLRTVLRQDPDVVMVGEIRDRETAELAMEASFTGHLVLSTLHTNDAPSSVIRMVDLGVERFLMASSLLMVVAQRLVRTICSRCRAPAEPDHESARQLGLDPADLDGVDFYAGAGCQVCDQTGYHGRIGVYEVMSITPELRELITQGATEIELARLARKDGMRTLREDGLAKALAGLTSLAEVLRVTPEETVEVDRSALDVSVAAGLEPARVVAPPTEVGPPRSVAVLAEFSRTLERGPRTNGTHPARGDRDHLLVVLDDAELRRQLRDRLDGEYAVLEAADAESAVALQEAHEPTAAVVGSVLPDGDALELIRRLRSHPSAALIPIVVAAEGRFDAAAALDAGADDCVTGSDRARRVHERLTGLLRSAIG